MLFCCHTKRCMTIEIIAFHILINSSCELSFRISLGIQITESILTGELSTKLAVLDSPGLSDTIKHSAEHLDSKVSFNKRNVSSLYLIENNGRESLIGSNFGSILTINSEA